ncbi:MAG: zeta toxin family protein [Dermabacter sp.]|nr:zeta toxin family protein [Dermabacter sp.]
MQGEQFFPLELASLVHEESSYLSAEFRQLAIEATDNIIVDTVLSDGRSALILGDQLAAAGYVVQVVDVEVPFELSEKRIRSRWEQEYQAALDGRSDLGGRWVPSEYARDVFDGPGGRSKPEHNARMLAEHCPAVVDYRVYRTGMDQAHLAQATPELTVHMKRSEVGAALEAVPVSQQSAPAKSGAKPLGVRDASFVEKMPTHSTQKPGVRPQRGQPPSRGGGVER